WSDRARSRSRPGTGRPRAVRSGRCDTSKPLGAARAGGICGAIVIILTHMTPAKLRRTEIPPALAGRRLDQALAALLPDVTRSQVQQWIAEGRVSVNARVPRKRDKVAGGEQVEIREPLAPSAEPAGESIPLDVVYEDAALLVLNKPPGLVV